LALGELIAALEREAAAEGAALRARATEEAARLLAAAGAEAAHRREQALSRLRGELAASAEATLAASRRRRREGELAGRAAVLARLRSATLAAAATAEAALPEAALGALVAAGCRYLPAGGAVLRCPPSLLGASRALAGGPSMAGAEPAAGALTVEESTAGEPLALLSAEGAVRVDCGLLAQVERRWPQLAIALLAALAAPLSSGEGER
jgi:hypothetical protein